MNAAARRRVVVVESMFASTNQVVNIVTVTIDTAAKISTVAFMVLVPFYCRLAPLGF